MKVHLTNQKTNIRSGQYLKLPFQCPLHSDQHSWFRRSLESSS